MEVELEIYEPYEYSDMWIDIGGLFISSKPIDAFKFIRW